MTSPECHLLPTDDPVRAMNILRAAADRKPFRGSVRGREAGLPKALLEQLSAALARWDGRGPTEDDMLYAGRELADASMAVLVWDAGQREAEM